MLLNHCSAGILGLVMVLMTGCSAAVSKANDGAPLGRGFVIRHLEGSDRKYGVFVPHDYDGTKTYPAILFLHGAFEGGSDPEKAFSVGLGPVIGDRAKTFEYIVIVPQTRGDWGPESKDLADAYIALQEVKKAYRVDPNRITLTGLSIGGYGVWALAQQHPSEFAALVPMCGYDKLDAVPAIKGIPTWIFHNSMDPFVGAGDSKAMNQALLKAGAPVKMTIYTAIGHDVWVRAYQEPELWTWIGQQHKR